MMHITDLDVKETNKMMLTLERGRDNKECERGQRNKTVHAGHGIGM